MNEEQYREEEYQRQQYEAMQDEHDHYEREAMIDHYCQEFGLVRIKVADTLAEALRSLEDYAGTVAPDGSYWDEIWPEHQQALTEYEASK